MSCSNATFTKQPYEEFEVAVDFSENMETDEVISSKTVTAVDKDDEDVTATIIASSAIEGTNQVSAVVKAGTSSASYYTITFKCVTSTGAKWQLDVSMKVTD